MSFDLTSYRRWICDLASKGVYVGSSSWRYPGWCGLVYDEQRYLTRSRFSEAKFAKNCLAEYAETYKTVCVDAGYYAFPTEPYVAGLCAEVPDDFRFAFKVTDEITIKRFPSLPRFGAKAGKSNPSFLDSELFYESFLVPLIPFRSQIGPLIFEFSTFHSGEFDHGRDFVAALDRFLSALPAGWEYGVEIRNRAWLQPEYFAMLVRHGVAHVFNSWTDVPPVSEQMAMEGSDTASFGIARFLLKPGVSYQQAVKSFEPYEGIKEPDNDARAAGEKFLVQSLQRKRRGYLYVNNRLEGCAPLTIEGMLPRNF